MIDFRDPKSSDKVRAALKEAESKGRLGNIAAKSGIAGGVPALRKIMDTQGELPVIDRGILGMYLE